MCRKDVVECLKQGRGGIYRETALVRAFLRQRAGASKGAGVGRVGVVGTVGNEHVNVEGERHGAFLEVNGNMAAVGRHIGCYYSWGTTGNGRYNVDCVGEP